MMAFSSKVYISLCVIEVAQLVLNMHNRKRQAKKTIRLTPTCKLDVEGAVLRKV